MQRFDQLTEPEPCANRYLSGAPRACLLRALCYRSQHGPWSRPTLETPGVKLPSHAPVAQGIEHRFPKPLGASAVPQPQDHNESAFRSSDNDKLRAVT
jgi:hypothetical protein